MANDIMIVTNTPGKNLVSTNFAYCSPADLRRFASPGSSLLFAVFADTCVLSIASHDDIPNGSIGLNAIQRKYLRVSTGDKISVKRFVLPEVFTLALLTLELDYVSRARATNEQIDAVEVSQLLKRRLVDQVLTVGQKATFEYLGNNFLITVSQAAVEGQENAEIERGILSADTYIVFEAAGGSGIQIINQRESASSNIFRQKEFDLKALGIGGLSAEFADIFRRAFASRVFPAHVTRKLGIKHVKGMLLYGPPGTGKTLMARQIGKMLNGKDPKSKREGHGH